MTPSSSSMKPIPMGEEKRQSGLNFKIYQELVMVRPLVLLGFALKTLYVKSGIASLTPSTLKLHTGNGPQGCG